LGIGQLTQSFARTARRARFHVMATANDRLNAPPSCTNTGQPASLRKRTQRLTGQIAHLCAQKTSFAV